MYTLPVVQNRLNETHKFPKVNSTILPILLWAVYIQKVIFNRAAGGEVVRLVVRNGAEHDDKNQVGIERGRV